MPIQREEKPKRKPRLSPDAPDVQIQKKKSKIDTLVIVDAWSVIKAHGNGDLKARYRKLVEELLK